MEDRGSCSYEICGLSGEKDRLRSPKFPTCRQSRRSYPVGDDERQDINKRLDYFENIVSGQQRESMYCVRRYPKLEEANTTSTIFVFNVMLTKLRFSCRR